MNPSYLVETDWAVHYLRGEPQIVKKLESLANEGLTLSVISLAELYRGVYLSDNPSQTEDGLNRFLSLVTVLPLDAITCQIYGQQYSRLQREGQIIDHFDLLIAATCLQHNLTLLTNNRRHFERIENLQIISMP